MPEVETADSMQILRKPAEAPKKRGHRKPPTYLKAHERDALIASINDPRDKAMIALMCFAGLRLNELVMLDRGDIDFSERTVLVRFAKGGKWRKLGLHPVPEAAIRDYLASRHDPDPALFLSNRCQRINWRRVEEIVDKHVAPLDFGRRVTPHCLRHTFATSLLRLTKDLQLVQRAMGHSNIQTTTIYLHLEDDELYGAMGRL